MADQAPKDPFDVLETIRSQNAPTEPAAKTPSEPAKNPFDVLETIRSGANLTPEQKASKEKNAAYEQRIQSWTPEASKQAKEQGYLGAVGQGVTNIPIVGPAVGAAGRYLAAATGAGSEKLKPEENTFSNRVQNISAWEEALNRQYGKQYPGTKALTEIGSSFALPAGRVAEAVTGAIAPAAGATGSLAALRSAVAPALGYGTEGALWGAGSAAAEHAFGTTPEDKTQGIGQSAIVGGGLGAALGTAGKAIQYGLEKIGPEWYRSLGKLDSRLADAAKQDIADGNVRMTPQQAVDSIDAGQPVTIADLYGPKWQQMLEKSLRGRPEIADEIQTALQNRTEEQGERFFNFVNTMRGTRENPQELFDRAQQIAARAKNESYGEALTPGRNHGVWKPEWDTWLNNPDFVNATQLTERELISQMTANGIDARNFISPFAQKVVQNPKTGEMVPAVNPVTGMPELEVQFQNRIDNQYLDVLQRYLNKLADNRFRATYAPQGGSAQGAAKMRNDIVNTLKQEEINGKPNPFFDPAYKQAHDNTVAYRENGNAFDYGSQILSKVGNARDAAQIELETRGMAPIERELATQGLLSDMYQRTTTGNGAINTKKLNNYFNPGPVRDSLRNILGEQNFNNLERYVKTEALMNNTMREINKMGRGNNYTQEIRTLLYALADYKLGGLRLVGQWASGRMGDKYAQDMVRKFSSGDINDFNEVYNTIISSPQNMNSFAKIIDSTAAKAAAAVGANAGQLQQSGKAFGGPVNHKSQQNKIIQSAASDLIRAAKPAMADGGDVAYEPHKRAEEQGFTIKGYHATKGRHAEAINDDGSFDPYRAAGGENAIFFWDNPKAANEYSDFAHPMKAGNRNNPTVFPVRIRHGKHKVVDWMEHTGKRDYNSQVMRDLINFHRKQGYDTLRIKNMREADMEDEGIKDSNTDPWDQIAVLNPQNIRSEYAKFDPKKISSGDLGAKKGGIIRPQRHTGGRIPEMDKLFKQAKKYVDSHTKGILNTPDDVVVKALRVAQRKF
jgi:hypothetical protein